MLPPGRRFCQRETYVRSGARWELRDHLKAAGSAVLPHQRSRLLALVAHGDGAPIVLKGSA